ncbi:TIGR02678 family protein [Rathayibacter soli]|uniref:TIGR02678 family protein n=1 Tax=Rathayibacter soli TaxID=3144168 RepID=UPI0027E46083|nr:TIGR02678 family protein [Glaciibacter superstes]
MSASGIDDQQRAARILLKHPLVRAVDEERYRLVKKHATELRNWFDTNTGWMLHIDSEVVRLFREPATLDNATHPIGAAKDVPFSRRRYVLLALCLAVLERSDAQIALGRMAEQVIVVAATPQLSQAGFVFTLTSYDERSDLVAAVQVLLKWGVLTRVSGDEQEFVSNTGDVLYDVSRRVLASLLVTRRGPSTVAATELDERMIAMRDRGTPPTEELHNLQLRHRLTRRLLDEPVLYFDELDEDEAAYLRGQRALITRRITELTGLVAEIRSEGIAMIDLEDDLTDLRMPEKGTDGHIALLLAEFLARASTQIVPVEDLRAHIRQIRPQYTGFWRTSAREPGSEGALAETALSRLAAMRLIDRVGDFVHIRPALARFTVAEPTIIGGNHS